MKKIYVSILVALCAILQLAAQERVTVNKSGFVYKDSSTDFNTSGFQVRGTTATFTRIGFIEVPVADTEVVKAELNICLQKASSTSIEYPLEFATLNGAIPTDISFYNQPEGFTVTETTAVAGTNTDYWMSSDFTESYNAAVEAGETAMMIRVMSDQSSGLLYFYHSLSGTNPLYVTLTLEACDPEYTTYNYILADGTSITINGEEVTQSGTYTVNSTTDCGAEKIETYNLLFISNGEQTTSYTICEGDELPIQTGANDYTYYSEAGTYTDVITTDDGTVSQTIITALTVNPLPVAATLSDTELSAGETTTFDAGAGFATYQWYINGEAIAGATNQTLTLPDEVDMLTVGENELSVVVTDDTDCASAPSVAVVTATTTFAQLSLPTIFSDNMVLQQNDNVSIWGSATANETVTIQPSWSATPITTQADVNGAWRAKLATPSASFDANSIVVSTSTKEVTLANVLIGEVWLCSGQSNMAYRLTVEDSGAAEIANAASVPLRLFHVPSTTSATPLNDIADATWNICSSTSVEDFSAVAYYMGKELLAALEDTPVGLISAAYGSSSIEAFLSAEALSTTDYLAEHLATYTNETTISKNPAYCYNAMINPLGDYGIKGMVWYQGEANCVRASHYYEALEVLIDSRRSQFDNEELPIYIVQLPPYEYTSSQQEDGDEYSAAVLREAQLLASKNIAHTGLVVTMDIGDPSNLHPTNKKDVGKRLSNLALNKAYGFSDIVCSGPDLREYTIVGDTISLYFDFIENGVTDTYEELKWFTVAGSDQKFYQGNAFVRGDRIVVATPYVTEPVALRYAWDNAAETNFSNVEGLPASPFRTDDWSEFTTVSGIETWSSMPDISNVPFELTVPDLTEDAPAAGKRVKQTLAAYSGTEVYHTLYLPTNWEEGKQYPVIVEYAGNGPYFNKYGDVCTGMPDDVYLAYGLSGGEDFICIGMPFISEDGQENQLNWWGDVEASVNYTIETVNYICENYGGNSAQVFAAGFSRGAIAVNYIGLHNDEIASLWCATIANSHYDGVLTTWGYDNCDTASALDRLARLDGKPQYIMAEGAGPSSTKTYIESNNVEGNFSYLTIPYRNHDARWTLQDIPERTAVREWLNNILYCGASITAPAVAEVGETVEVSINLSGDAPWDVTYAVNGVSTTVTELATSPYTFQLVATEETTIELLSVSNPQGEGTLGSATTIYIYADSLQVGINGMVRQTQADGYYADETFEVKGATSWARKGVAIFDISTLTTPLKGAALKLFLNTMSPEEESFQFSIYGIEADNDLYGEIDYPTYVSLPLVEASPTVSATPAALDSYLSFDITTHLNNLIAARETQMLLLVDAAIITNTPLFTFKSSRSTTGGQPMIYYAVGGDDTTSTQTIELPQSQLLACSSSRGELSIKNNGDSSIAYAVYNVSGTLCKAGILEALQCTVATSLPAGFYLVKAGSYTQKIVI